MEVVMQKWKYLQVHAELSKGKLVASANGEQVISSKDSAGEADLVRYLDSLGAEGWEMISAQKNEYGFQNYYFKRSIE
jgi:hypothetical protein